MALLRRPRWDAEISDFLRWERRAIPIETQDVPSLPDVCDSVGIAARIEQVLAVLAGYQRAEAQLERRVRRMIASGDPAQPVLDDPRTVQLYRMWGARLRELRALYLLAGVPDDPPAAR
jgi:hypothetical protein